MVGIASRIYILMSLKTSPKILKKPRKNIIFLTLTSPLGLYLNPFK